MSIAQRLIGLTEVWDAAGVKRAASFGYGINGPKGLYIRIQKVGRGAEYLAKASVRPPGEVGVENQMQGSAEKVADYLNRFLQTMGLAENLVEALPADVHLGQATHSGPVWYVFFDPQREEFFASETIQAKGKLIRSGLDRQGAIALARQKNAEVGKPETRPWMEALVEDLLGEVKLASGLRQKANAAISAATTNKYFPSIANGVTAVSNAVEQAGLGFETAGHYIAGDSGRARFDLYQIDTTPGRDPFTPHPEVDNAVLVFSWYKMGSGNYEITAYVS